MGYNDCYHYISNDGLSGFSITPDGDKLFADGGAGMQKLLDECNAKERNAVVQFIIDFIGYLKAKLSGNSQLTFELARLESKYVKMLHDSAKSETENKNTRPDIDRTDVVFADGGVSYSIKTDNDGDDVVVIDTDQGLFVGVSESEYRRIAKEYLNGHFKNTVLPLLDYNLVSVRKSGVNKYTYSGKKIENNVFNAKMRASTELDNLLKTSEYLKSSGDRKKHNFVGYGFDYFKTRFIAGGQVFEGILDIGVSKKGAEFYGMTHIENVTSRYYGKYSDILSGYKSVTQDDIYNNRLTQVNHNVNNSISIDLKKIPK